MPPNASPGPDRPTVFVSYSHEDEEWKDLLVRHLKVLEPEGALEVWDDRRIAAGEGWRSEIEGAMGRATVAVLLISADFLNSTFILGTEVRGARRLGGPVPRPCPALLRRSRSQGRRAARPRAAAGRADPAGEDPARARRRRAAPAPARSPGRPAQGPGPRRPLEVAGRRQPRPLRRHHRATLHRLRGNRAAAATDLSEVQEIAERGGMRLHACDAHLEWARLDLQQGDAAAAGHHVAAARRLVNETGYLRREREVAWLERRLGLRDARNGSQGPGEPS